MSKIIIDTEESAIEYIRTVLSDWDAWKTHHVLLVQALEVLLKTHKSKSESLELEQAKGLLDEEYAKAKRFGFIHNKLAYALYQVWKKADKERSENEQRKAD